MWLHYYVFLNQAVSPQEALANSTLFQSNKYANLYTGNVYISKSSHQQTETSSNDGQKATSNLKGGSAVVRGGRGCGSSALGGRSEASLDGCARARASLGTCRTRAAGGGGRRAIRGGATVHRGGTAILLALLLDGADASIVGAVVVAGQEVLVIGAEAGVVCCGTSVDLGLDCCETGIENAGLMSVERKHTGLDDLLLSSTGRGTRRCGRGC